jgi:hypothetical protein
MISKIEMFGFKGGAGYQLDRHNERLFERYNLRNEKAKEKKESQNNVDRVTFSEELEKAMGKRR